MNKNTTTFGLALASLLTTFAVGCTTGDNQVPDDDEDLMEEEPVVPVTPVTPEPARAKTCAEILAAKPGAPDGEYELFVDGDKTKPWTAHCEDMAGTPREYLPLKRLGSNNNFSSYAAGGVSPGTDVVTRYVRVRIDPATLAIAIGDQTFAHSSGALSHAGAGAVTSMPFGVAMACGAIGSANVDLTGTPFVIVDAFALGGAGPSGQTLKSTDQRSITISGEGYCGWNGPALAAFNPFNNAGGELALDYQR